MVRGSRSSCVCYTDLSQQNKKPNISSTEISTMTVSSLTDYTSPHPYRPLKCFDVVIKIKSSCLHFLSAYFWLGRWERREGRQTPLQIFPLSLQSMAAKEYFQKV